MRKVIYLVSMGFLALLLWSDFLGSRFMTGHVYNNSAIILPAKVVQWLCFLAGLQIVFELKGTKKEKYVNALGVGIVAISASAYLLEPNWEIGFIGALESALYTALLLAGVMLSFRNVSGIET